MNATPLAKELRRARKAKGLSLRDLAETLGVVTYQSLANYEKGSTPDSFTLGRLVLILGLEPARALLLARRSPPPYLR